MKRDKCEILIGHDLEVAKWMDKKQPNWIIWNHKKYSAIGVVCGKRIIAGLLFHNYFPQFGTIELGMVATRPMWAKKEMLSKLFEYPFEKLKVNRLSIVMEASNTKGIETAEHAGFKREGIAVDYFGKGKNGVNLRILKREYAQQGGCK